MSLRICIILALCVALIIATRKKLNFYPMLGVFLGTVALVAGLWYGVAWLGQEKGSFAQVVLEDCRLAEVESISISDYAADRSEYSIKQGDSAYDQALACISSLQIKSRLDQEWDDLREGDIEISIRGKTDPPVDSSIHYVYASVSISLMADKQGQPLLWIRTRGEYGDRRHSFYYVEDDEAFAMFKQLVETGTV